MTTLLRQIRFGLVATLLAVFALHVHGADAPAGTVAFNVDVPGTKLSAKQVHDIVIAASIQRQWSVKEDTTEKVIIYLNHRKNEATVTYLISEKVVQAYCEGYATNGKGVRKGPEQPTKWLTYLKDDISKGLNLAAYVDKK